LKHFLNHLYILFSHHGAVGLLILGILDSSFLFLPLGNDLLVIALSSRKHILIPYYAVLAAAGSVCGCFTLDVLFRAGGEKELEKHVSRKRIDYLRRRINKNAAWALVFASLMPPPFPFTPFVAGAAALQYPRRKLLSAIAIARLARFFIEGILAVFLGKRLIHIADSDAFEYAMGTLIVICIVGSVFSVVQWFKQSKGSRRARGSTARS
jgi:membrane protein YqaA with SNARE-associated domain